MHAPQKGKSQSINANKAHEKVYFNIVRGNFFFLQTAAFKFAFLF